MLGSAAILVPRCEMEEVTNDVVSEARIIAQCQKLGRLPARGFVVGVGAGALRSLP